MRRGGGESDSQRAGLPAVMREVGVEGLTQCPRLRNIVDVKLLGDVHTISKSGRGVAFSLPTYGTHVRAPNSEAYVLRSPTVHVRACPESK